MAFAECATKVFIRYNFQTMMVTSRMAICRVHSSIRMAYGSSDKLTSVFSEGAESRVNMVCASEDS